MASMALLGIGVVVSVVCFLSILGMLVLCDMRVLHFIIRGETYLELSKRVWLMFTRS